MLALDETLFVEHKGAEPDYPLAKAVASFANQLGGWVLVNTKDGKPLGSLPEWISNAASPVDAVRDRLNRHIDPMPPFEVRDFDLGDGKAVLLVRVYESADTPHILSDGAIYVRGVAQDKRSDPIYRPVPIENQQALRALVERGEASRKRVADLLKPRIDIPLGNSGIGVQFTRAAGGLVPHSESPLMSVRLAPHTLSGRFHGWARSAAALTLGKDAVVALTGSEQIEAHPHSQGFWLQARMGSDRAPMTEGNVSLAGPARLAVDAVGLGGVGETIGESLEAHGLRILGSPGPNQKVAGRLRKQPPAVAPKGGTFRCSYRLRQRRLTTTLASWPSCDTSSTGNRTSSGSAT